MLPEAPFHPRHNPQSVGHQIVYFDQEDDNSHIGIMQQIHNVPRHLLI